MATQALLLCRDPDVVGVLGPMLDKLGLEAEVCDAHDSALDLLSTRKFNPVIVDCEQMQASSEVLRSLRQSPATRDCIALGIIGDDTQQHDAFALGANLVLHKPVTPEEAGKILRTARGLISRMRRECMRYVVHTLAYVHVDGLSDTPMLLDISEGGMAIQALEPLEERRAFAVRFSLPYETESFEAVVAVVWADSSGRAGLRFLGMPPVERERLRRWLDDQGASGPPEPDAPEDSAERVRLPLQLAPAALTALSAVMDMLIVLVAVAAFGAIAALARVPIGEEVGTSGLTLLVVCWLIYRYVFFGALTMTPGGHVTAAMADRCLAWRYNRRQASVSNLNLLRGYITLAAVVLMSHVLIATSNPGKLRDFAAAASEFGIEIAPVPGFRHMPAVAEDGVTFEENARKKSEHYSRLAPGELVLADDSGLEVDALGGAPGVRSARYAATADAENSSDAENNARLLRELHNAAEPQRSARFVCVIAAARDGQVLATFRGAAEGRVLFEARGRGGFGYDPLFYFPALKKTFAELTAEEKATVSHRGQAFRGFLDWFRSTPL